MSSEKLNTPSRKISENDDMMKESTWKYISYNAFSPVAPNSPNTDTRCNYTRSYSFDDWGDFISQNDILHEKLEQEKKMVDKACEYFLKHLPNMKELESHDQYQKSLQSLEGLAKEIIALESQDLKEGRSKKYVKKMQAILGDWHKDWPVKRVITKLILSVSRISRIVQFIVRIYFFFQY